MNRDEILDEAWLGSLDGHSSRHSLTPSKSDTESRNTAHDSHFESKSDFKNTLHGIPLSFSFFSSVESVHKMQEVEHCKAKVKQYYNILKRVKCCCKKVKQALCWSESILWICSSGQINNVHHRLM